MILGNIITEKHVEVDERFKVYTYEEEILDSTLPILYVGFDKIKNIEVNSLNRQISDKVFWTFNKNESNKYFIKDLFDFKIFCHYYKIKNTTYTFINPFKNYSEIKRILNFFNDKKSFKTIITNSNMIYFSIDELIFGFDLNFISFCNIKKEKLIEKIKNKSIIFKLENDLNNDIKLFIELMDDEKFIPYLL